MPDSVAVAFLGLLRTGDGDGRRSGAGAPDRCAASNRAHPFAGSPMLRELLRIEGRVSNTLTTDFCIEAVQEAIARFRCPEIFNTDQGCQFTNREFTQLLKDHGIRINMDGKGCWRDNVFVERLWKSVKNTSRCICGPTTRWSDAKAYLGAHLNFYNQWRPHQSLDRQTPDAMYFAHLPQLTIAA